jgi:hypothetical protein
LVLNVVRCSQIIETSEPSWMNFDEGFGGLGVGAVIVTAVNAAALEPHTALEAWVLIPPKRNQ